MRAVPVAIDWRPTLSIYASEPFLKAVSDTYGWIGGLDGAGTLQCVLPYTIVRRGPFQLVRLRVETIPLREELGIQQEKAFLNSAIDYFRSIGAHMIIPPTTNAVFRTYPDGAVAAPYGTYVLDLTQSETALWSNLNASHRRKVRLAMKEGVQIQSGIEFIAAAYDLIRNTFKRSHLGFMRYNAFQRYVVGLKDNIKIFMATHRGVMQACLVVPFSQHSAYYVYGGSLAEPSRGATNLLHWEAIRHFADLGVRSYDFVGVRIDPEKNSKQEGLMLYKQRFGGRLVKGYLWKYPLRRLPFALYSVAVGFTRNGDIIDQERRKLDPVATADICAPEQTPDHTANHSALQ